MQRLRAGFRSRELLFEKNGILFIGTASGPNMRMAPALVPREQLLWLDSVLTSMRNPQQPVVFINHYPLDESMSNYGKVLELLGTRNVRVSLMGHGHSNKQYDFGGLRESWGVPTSGQERRGYNLVTFRKDTLFFAERVTGMETLPSGVEFPWWSGRPILLARKINQHHLLLVPPEPGTPVPVTHNPGQPFPASLVLSNPTSGMVSSSSASVV